MNKQKFVLTAFYDEDLNKYILMRRDDPPTWRNVCENQLIDAIRDLKAIKANRHYIINQTRIIDNNRFDIPNMSHMFNKKDGVCQILDRYITNAVKFYIAQSFSNDLVYPVGMWHPHDHDDLWENTKRWVYVDHCIAQCEKLLEMVKWG